MSFRTHTLYEPISKKKSGLCCSEHYSGTSSCILLLPLFVRPIKIRRISCHLNSVYILNHSKTILWDLIGIVLKMRSKFVEISFLTQESIKGPKRPYWWIVVIWNMSTCQRVDNWYSRIWLGMAIRCGNFHFIPRGKWGSSNDVFFFFCKVHQLNYINVPSGPSNFTKYTNLFKSDTFSNYVL